MKIMKKLLIYVLIAMLAVTCIPPVNASAADVSGTPATAAAEQNTSAEEEPADDDGLMLREYEDFAGLASKKVTPAVDSSHLTHNSKFGNFVVENGVDISHHNGIVDWEKVKADNVDFAIIRMAYRGYGSTGKLRPDDNAIENIVNARAAGLQVGVYIFSQAINVEEAEEEADYILKMIKGYNIDLPVVLDYEYTAGDAGRLQKAKNKGMTDRERTDVCLAFCKKVEEAGYDAMVYANRTMLKDDLFADEIDAEYEIWLAEWGKKAYYDNDYTYWQYTSDGSVDGVPSQRVDLNVRYTEAPFKITSSTDTTVSMEWRPIDGAEGYVIFRKHEEDTVYSKVATIEDPTATTYTDTGLETNTVYSYFVRYYKTDENGVQTIYKSGFPAQKGLTTLKLQKPDVKVEPVDAGTVTMTWMRDPNAEGYEIQQFSDTKGKYETIATVTYEEDGGAALDSLVADFEILDDGSLVVIVPDLTAGNRYQYRTRSFAHMGGAKLYSNYSTPATVNMAAELTKPVLTVKSTNYTTNRLSWKKVPGATSYQVQKYNYSKKKWETLKTVTGTATNNTYLNSGTTYKYRVRAVAKPIGKNLYSNYSTAVTCKTQASVKGVVTDGPLNIRKGPGTAYKSLTKVKAGRQLTITGSTAKWYRVKIKINGVYKTGYASKTYVKLK